MSAETASPIVDCARPTGRVGSKDDCDDRNEDVHPDADEVPGNGLDDDCDPTTTDAVDTDTGVDTDTADTDTDTDTDSDVDTDSPEPETGGDTGETGTVAEPPAVVCGCQSGGIGAAWMGIVALLALRRRSR